MKKSIAFILPYFGKFHNYFQLFLNSCEKNPDVTWFLFTDQKENYHYPQNVRVTYLEFEKLRERIQEQYDFPIVLDTPYDLCDFKVAYGEIFEEELKGFDFWGFCDCDLIFGNIREILTEELLEKYDKIFLRGHCTIFRNTKELNRIYRNPIDGVLQYKLAFSEAGAHHFDEGYPELVPGINRIYADTGREIYDGFLFADIEVERWAFRQADYQRIPGELDKCRNSVFAWEDGNLYRYYLDGDEIKRESFLYIHLQKRKMKDKRSQAGKQTDSFLIYPNVFADWQKIDRKNIKRFNRNHIYVERLKVRIKDALRRRIGQR